MATKVITVWLAIASSISSHPNPNHPKSSPNDHLPLPAHLVAQASSNPLWLENIAVRPNGDLLITELTPTPTLYIVKNPNSSNAKLEPIYTFIQPNITDLLGIYETHPDTYAVVAGNVSSSAVGYPDTFSIWEAKFTSTETYVPSVKRIANIPGAKLLNGIIPLPNNPKILLIADSQFGLLFRLDARTGKSEIILDAPELKPYPEIRKKDAGFGVNGVRFMDGWLYFSNSNLVKIYRVRITSTGYVAYKGANAIEQFADLSGVTDFIDDFTFGTDGTLWAVSNYGNTVIAVSRDGKEVKTVVGAVGDLVVAGGTAAAFGRGREDRDVLYVVTSGGLAGPVNGTIAEAGKVVAVDTKSFECW